MSRLDAGFERLKGWAQGRYEGLVGELLRDLRIFTATNAVMLLLAFFAARSTEAPRRVLTVISAALIGASVIGAWFYLFRQDWLHTLIFSDYVGTAYLVWVALILLVELDMVLNKARVVNAVVSGLAGALGT